MRTKGNELRYYLRAEWSRRRKWSAEGGGNREKGAGGTLTKQSSSAGLRGRVLFGCTTWIAGNQGVSFFIGSGEKPVTR